MDSRGASAGLVADPRGQCEVLAERARIELLGSAAQGQITEHHKTSQESVMCDNFL